MNFDEQKWADIVKQWESDDNADAADQLESDKDAMDLAQPSTWAAKDALDAGARKLTSEAAEPVRLRPPQLPSPEPATVGAGEKGPSASLRPEPTASPKLPPPSSLDWKGLQDRLARAEAAKSTAQGYETLFANVGAQSGYRPNVHAGEEGVAMARAPLELAKERQAYESKQGAIDVNKAMSDPNSLQSQKAREAIQAMFPGIKLPPTFPNWSAADIQRFAKTGDLTRLEGQRQANERAVNEHAAKQQAAAEKAQKSEAELAQMRKTWAPEFKKANIDPNTATPADLQRVLQIRGQDISDKNADATRALAAAQEQRRAGEAEALKGGIPFAGGELHYTGAGAPREDDRREAQKTAAGYGAAIAGMDDMAAKLGDFAKKPTPATKAALDSAARLTAGHLNTAYGQGAMSQDEAEQMAKTLGASFDKVTGFQFVMDKLVGDDPAAAEVMLRRLKSAKQNTMASALAKAKAYHYEPQGGGASGSVKMKFPDGSVHDVSPDKLEKARKKGGVPVDG